MQSLAILILAPLILLSPARVTAANFDIVLHATGAPYGKAVASGEFAGIVLQVQHVEYFGIPSAEGGSGGAGEDRPLRHSSLGASRRFDLGDPNGSLPFAELPFSLSISSDETADGSRDLRMTADGGLDLPGFRLSHHFTVARSFTADRQDTGYSAGRLALELELFGGRQEASVDYDAGPLTRATRLSLRSEWTLDAQTSTVVEVVNRPLDRVTEARFGLRRPLGPFKLISDAVVDSLGGYAAEVTLALPLSTPPQSPDLSLANLLSAIAGPSSGSGVN